MVLAPEHELVEEITTAGQKDAVNAYVAAAGAKSDLERTELSKEKTGVFTGATAVNPVNGEEIPVWISDYVLATYGTGAIMSVPGHDERDFEFAKAFSLPVRRVVGQSVEDAGTELEEAFTDSGIAVSSGLLDGLKTSAAKEKMIEWLEEKGIGERSVNYRLRDWNFSRQRYWGEPFPLIHKKDGEVAPLSYDELPLELPQVESYEPTGTGESPLAGITEWVEVKDPETGEVVLRETNTMPQWAGSCWYYLRYIDPHNQERPWDRDKEKYWMPVDLYVGGAEHAVLHLLYARFWHKVLFDLGEVSTPEPFGRLVNQGLILGEDGEKMSKSRGNVVNPDDIIEQFGADAMRLYEMFMGPLEMVKPWATSGIHGVKRFLDRAWRLCQKPIVDAEPPLEQKRALHKAIKKVTEDIEGLRFNTAISGLMILVNELTPAEVQHREIISALVKILNPFAPHVAEEIWRERLGGKGSVNREDWPSFDPSLLEEDTVTIVVHVNGKLRGRLEVAKNTDKTEIEQQALALESIQAHTEGKTVRRVIVVPGKLVNIVAN